MLLLMASLLTIELVLPPTDKIVAQLRETAEYMSSARLNEAVANTLIAGDEEAGLTGVSAHITEAAKSRHKTADGLGAQRSGYLEQAAENILAIFDESTAGFQITQSAAIFARVFGPKRITIQDNQWLCIPASKKSYNTSPLSWEGWLDFAVLKPGKLAAFFWRDTQKAARREDQEQPQQAEKPQRADKSAGKSSDKSRQREVAFWCVKEVTLPQDRELLPSDEDLIRLIARGAEKAVTIHMEELARA